MGDPSLDAPDMYLMKTHYHGDVRLDSGSVTVVPQRALLGSPAARTRSRLMLRPCFPHTSPEHS